MKSYQATGFQVSDLTKIELAVTRPCSLCFDGLAALSFSNDKSGPTDPHNNYITN